MTYLTLARWMAPIILLIVFGLYCYASGKSHVQAQWDREKSAQQALVISQQNKIQALSESAELQNRTIETIRQNHERTLQENRKRVDLALARRLRDDRAENCANAMSKTSETAGVGDSAESTRVIVLSERVAKGLTDRQQRADQIVESLRSCQSYLKMLESYR